jgi:2-methylcitrate dehydratase PrpD
MHMKSPVATESVEHEAKPLDAIALSSRLAQFVERYDAAAIPADVRARAKFLMLDSVGVAIASSNYDFARGTLTSLQALAGPGNSTVIGTPQLLPLRDAVLMNGLLVHGIDYDDTHLASAVHPTASALPCALGLAEHLGLTGEKLLAAYVLGVEIVVRLGRAAPFGFHRFGFHPTGVLGHFSCALQAGWLLGLDRHQLTMAQGIVGSTAAASQEFLTEGAWNKRLHPGWAGVAGITAAYLARGGFVGALKTFEGRFGLFRSHLHELESEVDYSKIPEGLGEVWELAATSVKPYPICHFIHACAESSIKLQRKYGLEPDNIARVEVSLPREGLPVVTEPEANKIRPESSYDAQFSAQFVVAACLILGRFGLAELEPTTLSDPRILDLARKVKCEVDTASAFPEYYSGGVAVITTDGRRFHHHERINPGAGERALTGSEIEAKFMANAGMCMTSDQSAAIRDCILELEKHSAGKLGGALKKT